MVSFRPRSFVASLGTKMPVELSVDLPPLDLTVREALLRSRDKFALSDVNITELAWAAFYRNWDAPMLESWVAAKRCEGNRIEIPRGPAPKPLPIDPLSPLAFAEFGLRNGILPGRGVLDQQGWAEVDGRAVSLGAYSRAARRLLREQAAANPNGALARELRALEAHRRRARWTMALTSPPVARLPMRSGGTDCHRMRRSRRVRRARGAGQARARRGADPPEPEPEPPHGGMSP